MALWAAESENKKLIRASKGANSGNKKLFRASKGADSEK